MSLESPEDRPKRVLFFATCLVDQFFPEVGEATVHLLESADIEVIYPEGLTCCGLPHFNNGFRAEARKNSRYPIASTGGRHSDYRPLGLLRLDAQKRFAHIVYGRPVGAGKSRANRRAGNRVIPISVQDKDE